jgi:uroporphyrin-3 C-methyltransferase
VTDETTLPETSAASDAPTSVTQSTPTLDAPAAAPKQPKSSKAGVTRSGNGGVWVVLVLLIAALMYGAWFLLQHYQQQQKVLISLQEQLQQQQQALVLQKQTLETDIDQQIAQQRENVQASLHDMGQRLDSTAARVLAMSSVNRDDWKLTEAEYLLRLANQRIQLERSSTNALALAQTVDDILRNLNDTNLHAIRRALADEMGELALVGDIDREGVYLQLMKISQQVEALPLIQSLAENEEPWLLAGDEPIDSDSLWGKTKKVAHQLLQNFKHHLRIRDHVQASPAILPPDAQAYLKQNINLMLEQAQVAFLRDESQIYQASLDKTNQWLVKYFPLSPELVTIQAEIAELQNLMIGQPLPTFTESTGLLQAFVERKHQRLVEQRGSN